MALACTAPCYAEPPAAPPLVAHSGDYVYGYYPYGWRNRDPHGDIVFAVQTPSYALLLNATKARITKAGAVTTRIDAAGAARQGNDAVLGPLPDAPLTFQVRIGDTVYDAATAAPTPDAVVIQRLGKYLCHVEVRGVTLRAPDGTLLADVDARIIAYAWPDHARVLFQITPSHDLADCSIVARAALADGPGAVRAVDLDPTMQTSRRENGAVLVERTRPSVPGGTTASVCVGLFPAAAKPDTAGDCIVRAEGLAPYTGDLAVARDPAAGWRQIILGGNADIWTMERVRVTIENPADVPRTLRLAFSKRGGGFGITGMSPVLCDSDGAPLGLPIQISKNWHVSPPWFDGITMLDVAPRATHTLEFRLAYAQWGGVPAVSHAQLALEGWGTHQLWDESAIGSFGESITYDPDVNLGRALIDDVRPLMVWGMGKEPQRKWSWTHNVGGGDFLVLERNGARQYLGRQKTEYESYGPVMTKVHYTGETPDGAVESRVTVQSWRSDDFVRGLYTLRYDVTKPVEYSRLAFFQLAADRYNTNLFASVSRGTLAGLDETWAPPMGGKSYSRERQPLPGERPWFAFNGNTKNPPPIIAEGDVGAWADRGLIVHRWSARLGGEDAPLPHYSVFGTEDGNVPSAVVELSAPPGVVQLQPGDHVDAMVEMVILPQRADDYYGPNEAFRAALREHGGAWNMVHREAVGASVRVNATHGSVKSQWPLVVRAENGRRADFTVERGNGWLPITIVGAATPDGAALAMTRSGAATPLGQTGANDWWQTRYMPSTQTYELAYTVPLDTLHSSGGPATFIWSSATADR